MDYQEALEKLEKLLDGYKKRYITHEPQDRPDLEELCMLYGELEELIIRFVGIQEIFVKGDVPYPSVYSNYIDATLNAPYPHHAHEGYTQLLKVIGKVRQHAQDPAVPRIEYSMTNLVQILRRFRECCQYLISPLQDESAVQSVLWVILRSHFERVEKEETLRRFGTKSYRPDFGVPDLRVLVEAKFVGPKTEVPSIQDGILADIPGYLKGTPDYDAVVVFIYDGAQKLRDPTKVIEDLKAVDGIVDVIVVPGIG